jgi:hypothetical protein
VEYRVSVIERSRKNRVGNGFDRLRTGS